MNKSLSKSEIENAFFNHAANTGVIFTSRPLIVDGVLHRDHIDGDKRGTKNGAYIVHADSYPSGWYLHFNTGLSGRWTLSGKHGPFNKVMMQQIETDRIRRGIELHERQNAAANKARFIWRNATPITEQSQHSYLLKKHVHPYQVRLHHGCLVIPIYDQNKQLVNLQFIAAHGIKRFLSSGRKKGCFSVIGKMGVDGIIQVAEGWATGASLYEATGSFTVIAMDAGNLEPVALVLRRLYPDMQIIICGDNDKSGTGQKSAQSAALAVNGKYIIPPVVGFDFNDMLTMAAVK